MSRPPHAREGTKAPRNPYTWDSGPVHHPNPAETLTAPRPVHPQFLPTWETTPPTPTPRPVPDPATLNWLLRKASHDVVHARRDVFKEQNVDYRTRAYEQARERYTAAWAAQEWLADIIREQEGTK